MARLLLFLVATHAAALAAAAHNCSCPTITTTAFPGGCTPRALDGQACITPDCIVLRSLTVPCVCAASAVPTRTLRGPCACPSGCATTTEIVRPPCPTS